MAMPVSARVKAGVDAVADHGNAALRLQGADFGFLARRQNACNDVVGVQADRCADVAGRGGIVAGQQHDLQAQSLHLVDGRFRGFLDDVGHADDARRLAGQREIQRRDAVGAHGVARLGQIVRQLAVLADEVCVAARDDFARNFAL